MDDGLGRVEHRVDGWLLFDGRRRVISQTGLVRRVEVWWRVQVQ
jgi:hypothetical protein